MNNGVEILCEEIVCLNILLCMYDYGGKFLHLNGRQFLLSDSSSLSFALLQRNYLVSSDSSGTRRKGPHICIEATYDLLRS
jgi:hypothetical protein